MFGEDLDAVLSGAEAQRVQLLHLQRETRGASSEGETPTVGMEAAQTQAAVYRKLHVTCAQTADFLSLTT